MAASESVFQNAAQGAKLAAANSQFALDLYLRRASHAGNIFVSPLSISVALAMTYAGARADTKSQMKDVLKFGELEEDHLHQLFSDLRTSLNKPEKPFVLYMANRLFGERSYTFLEEFLSLGRKQYGADLAAVDFRGDQAGAAATINGWVADNTNKMITEIVPLSAINSLTRLILVNAIYFKGNWAKKFDAKVTKPDDFHITPSETLKVDMMCMKDAKFNYGSNHELVAQAIELPYVGDTLSMFIVLPDTTKTLQEVESKLTIAILSDVQTLFRMSERKVHVWIPKFRLDEKLELSQTLTEMGMGDAFSDSRADFSAISGNKDLYISKVLHRAVVEVTEEGTEAAAATAVVMMTRCAMIAKDPFEFRANRPFLFFIRDNVTGSVLFLGRVVKPETVAPKKDEL